MDVPPPDLDEARRLVAAHELVAEASRHLTDEVAMNLPFHALVSFKNYLKRFFSAAPWSPDDADRLSDLVTEHVTAHGWWEHDLGEGLVLAHGFREGCYVLWVAGGQGSAGSVFDRAFAGPVLPEPTPHPRKVKFNLGGSTAPGRWYRRDDDVDNEGARALLDEDDVTDVMVAGDFVTVGLARTSSWEDRLDEILERVTELFWKPGTAESEPPVRTRDQLVGEGLRTVRPEELHLLDPNDPAHRVDLESALRHPEAEIRRVALATLAQADDAAFVARLLDGAYEDDHRIVRRMAVDAAADLEDESMRPLFERALGDADQWTRWKAVRGLREIGIASSRAAVSALGEDPDFQVRFEVAAALHEDEG